MVTPAKEEDGGMGSVPRVELATLSEVMVAVVVPKSEVTVWVRVREAVVKMVVCA